jgi:hypothetical protein
MPQPRLPIYTPDDLQRCIRPRRKTPIQDAILEFLRDWKRNPENDGNSPTFEQIAKGIGKYRSDVRNRVLSMEKNGLIRINKYGKIALPGGKYLLPE